MIAPFAVLCHSTFHPLSVLLLFVFVQWENQFSFPSWEQTSSVSRIKLLR